MTTSLDEAEQVATGGEREVLERFLDYQRRAVRNKLVGVSEEDARRRLVPSLTTLGGLVKHLAAVERVWFQRVLAGHSPEAITGYASGDSRSWRLALDETVDDLLSEYESACATSREMAAAYALDDTGEHHRLGKVALRWIYAHMIEETARHAGHADILREQIDGATGDG